MHALEVSAHEIDQINSLLADPDVATAMRMFNGHTPRLPVKYPTPSISSGGTPRPSRPTSPRHQEPFIVRAPPALMQDTDRPRRDRNISAASTVDGRDRGFSVSSSIAPPAHSTWTSRHGHLRDESSPARLRARAGSRLEMDGGHVPFTHHVPPMPPMQVDDADDGSVTAGDTSTLGGHEPIRESKNGEHIIEKGMPKSRLSQLFHLKKKKSKDSFHSEKQHNKLEKPDRWKEEKGKEARDRAKEDKDAERKRLEHERREAELAQGMLSGHLMVSLTTERRFYALTQVAAHPGSERAAYRASSHLRAYYNHIFEGIENPPGVNPLAILRWKHRTEEQTEARTSWEKENRANLVAEFGQFHASPMSVASKDQEPTSTKSKQAADKWRYTMGDVSSYNDAGGVVNYFVPPRPTFDQRPSSLQTASSMGRSPSPMVQDDPCKSINGETSSVTGSMDRRYMSKNRVTSASSMSLADAAPSNASNEALSRSASDHRRNREHRVSHAVRKSLTKVDSSYASEP